MKYAARAIIYLADAKQLAAQGMVEYGLVLVLVSVAAIAGLLVLGPKVSAAFSGIANSV